MRLVSQVTELEREVVRLLGEGYARWKIAQEVGLGETTVRDVIKRLCKQYDCSQRDLPAKAKEHE